MDKRSWPISASYATAETVISRGPGGEMRVVLPETPARRIFEITGLEDVLSVYPTREAALEADSAG